MLAVSRKLALASNAFLSLLCAAATRQIKRGMRTQPGNGPTSTAWDRFFAPHVCAFEQLLLAMHSSVL